jgi:hypothetical protein
MTPTDRFDDDLPRTSRPAYSSGLNPIEQVLPKSIPSCAAPSGAAAKRSGVQPGWPSAASHPPNVAITSETAVMHALGETALT